MEVDGPVADLLLTVSVLAVVVVGADEVVDVLVAVTVVFEVTVVEVTRLVVVEVREVNVRVVVEPPLGASEDGPPDVGTLGVTDVDAIGVGAVGVSVLATLTVGATAGAAGPSGVFVGDATAGITVVGVDATGSTGRELAGAGVTGDALGVVGATGVTVGLGSVPPTGGDGGETLAEGAGAGVPPADERAVGRLATSWVAPADRVPVAVEAPRAVAGPVAPLTTTLRFAPSAPPISGQLTPARWLPNVATATTNATAARATGTAKITRRRDTYLNIGKSELQHKPRQSFVDRSTAIRRTSVHAHAANPSIRRCMIRCSPDVARV